MPTRYFIINDEELGRIQSTNLMHLGFWVNENADKDRREDYQSHSLRLNSGIVVGFGTSNANTGNIVKFTRAHCIHVDVIFNFFCVT